MAGGGGDDELDEKSVVTRVGDSCGFGVMVRYGVTLGVSLLVTMCVLTHKVGYIFFGEPPSTRPLASRLRLLGPVVNPVLGRAFLLPPG